MQAAKNPSDVWVDQDPAERGDEAWVVPNSSVL